MEALLHTFGIDWRLLAIQAANFAVLAALLTWLLYKPVLKAVKERERVISKGVEDAESAANELAEAGGKAKSLLTSAELSATEIVKGARSEGAAEKAALVKEAEARAAQIAKDAEARAAEEAALRRRESEREIARLAVLAAEKVLAKK